MYKDTQTWNRFKGCNYGCTYCKKSFQAQNKRLKHRCTDCYNYIPHYHPTTKIPSKPMIFVAGNGDITFCDPSFVKDNIIPTIKKHLKRANKQFLFQSKNPICFKQYKDDLASISDNVILGTTLETNRDTSFYTKAPSTAIRFEDFRELDYPRKTITIEPVMDFDKDIFLEWIKEIKPIWVWIGYNSRPKSVKLSEPSEDKLRDFILSLRTNKIEVKFKDLRGMII